MDDWQLYQEADGRWVWQVWDEVNNHLWISDPFEDYNEAKLNRNSMMSDMY